MNPTTDSLTVNGKKVPLVRYGKYQEIILWWALDGQLAKIPRPIPPPLDSYWAQWTVTYKNALQVADGHSPKEGNPRWPILDKKDGILSPGQDLFFGPNTIINIVKTDNA